MLVGLFEIFSNIYQGIKNEQVTRFGSRRCSFRPGRLR
jgi:hypothetical protein